MRRPEQFNSKQCTRKCARRPTLCSKQYAWGVLARETGDTHALLSVDKTHALVSPGPAAGICCTATRLLNERVYTTRENGSHAPGWSSCLAWRAIRRDPFERERRKYFETGGGGVEGGGVPNFPNLSASFSCWFPHPTYFFLSTPSTLSNKEKEKDRRRERVGAGRLVLCQIDVTRPEKKI